MKRYYAIFKETKNAIEVEFPDLPGCVSFGKDWDEAINNATDALAGWLANAEPQFIQEPSNYKKLNLKIKSPLVPIQVDASLMESYQTLKRFNVIFPLNMLQQIDRFRQKIGLKRSTFLIKAAEEYLHKHA
jgi:predicted RNase H-like HicB family nuclease